MASHDAPEISIILPVYNVAPWLPRALDSILAQTYTNYEVVCVDDGSTDASSEILAQYANAHKQMRVIRQNNAGLAAARNIGIHAACGRWIYFMDSDDYIHPQLLETTLYYARKYQAELVYFSWLNTERSDEEMPEIHLAEIEHEVTDRPLYLTPPMRAYAWSKLYARHLFDNMEFDPSMRFGEDLHFTYRLLTRPVHTVALRATLYYYRRNRPGALTSRAMHNLCRVECEFCNLHMLIDLYDKPNLKKERDILATSYPIATILADIHRACKRAPKAEKSRLLHKLADTIRELKRHNMFIRRGHKTSRYLKYLWLLMRY